jgi:hypothetical protein
MKKPFDCDSNGFFKNREEAHIFEQLDALAATCVRVYPADRSPQLRFLARLVNEPNES